MKQEVQPSAMIAILKKDKAIRETEFFKHMGNIFQDHLNVSFWTDADEDGLTGGVSFEMLYEGGQEVIHLSNGKIEVFSYDADGENEEETILSKEQLEAINLLLWEFQQEEGERQADHDYYTKHGEYAYNGVSIRDFI